MAQSTQRAVSDGTLVSLDLSINYLDRSEIAVYFDAVLTTAWAWVGETAKQITFSPAVPNGVEVLVKRTTDISKLRHEFSKGAAFTAEVLDEDLTQVLHIAQEASEANLSGQFYSDIDMHNYRIRNIGTAVDDTDALTLGQYKADANGAFASKTAAAASATAAANSATAAAGSATTAGTHATNAGNSATAAANSASAAATSATNAANASRLTVGTVTTGTPGSAAAVTIAGAAGSQTVSFTIPRGDVGATGPANTLAIGTVTSGASAAATITGTAPNQTLNLTLPKGDTGNTGATGPAGPANTLAIGTVTTGAAGSSAAASITGTAPNQTLNLTIPQGIQGPQGPQGIQGPQGPAGAGSGDVLGPGTATVDNELVLWDGTTGTRIKRAAFSGLVKTASGVASAAVAGTDYVVPSGSITGNAATAIALKTARTINGTSFSGTANITTSLWGTSRTVTIGGTGKAVNGSANVSWSLAEIGAQAADADLTAIAALTGTGLLRRTGVDTWEMETTAYAPLVSPSLTGAPTAPTASTGTNTEQISTTAFVQQAFEANRATATPLMSGEAAVGSSTKLSKEDHVHPTDTTRAAAVHSHAISDVNGLQAALDSKMPADAVVAPPSGGQVFTASGTFTVPTGVTSVKVRGCGGGRGGGDSPGAGGTTSFGSYCTATGGSGSAAGTATGGDINLAGGKGGTTPTSTGSNAGGGVVGGGNGSSGVGASPTGLLGGTGGTSNVAGATGYGNGGGASYNGTEKVAGHAGGYFEKYITGLTPGTVINVVIGAEGAGGTGGSRGSPGVIIVEW